MAPTPKTSGNTEGSGASTPPSTEMGTLIEEDQLTIGALYWVEDDRGNDVWATAEVLDQCEGHVMVQMVDSGERKEINLDLEEMFPKNPSVVPDMTALHHIHEPGILHNLKERSRPWRQTPYTFMGTILLAVNPLKAVPMPPVEQFMDQPLDPETPHPYAIAELAYRQMRLAGGRSGTNQSIVVSGESGAGKTETVKIILSYLTRRSKGADEDLEARVLESSPLLESFGNAKTLRNDNSSRFGKFLKLRFTSGESSYLLGASVEPYLLEKSRVLVQGEGERNFHILYELLAGSHQSDLGNKLKLKHAREYRVLSSNGCITLEGVDDADRFKAIQDAFTTVGVDSDAQLQVWQALAGVLHMSELEIEEADHEEGPVAAITDRETLSSVAEMLGIEAQKLEETLTLKIVPVTRGEVFTKRLGKMEAIRGRGAVVKSLYEAMFLWVVRAINIALGGTTKVASDEKLPFIGLLDIFGFENFGHKNNLEQLLINYANESLQGDFNRQVFENELRVYAEEGIEVSMSNTRYSSSCLKMLTAKRDGVLPILDDVCSQPLPSDKRYLERLHVAFATRQGQGMDVEKTGTRDVSSRSSYGSDADDASAGTSPGMGRKSSSEMVGVRGYWAGTDDEGAWAGGKRTSASSGNSRKWEKLDKGGSEVGSTHSNDDAVTEIMSLEWLGRGGALADDFRTEEHESFWVSHYASKVLYTVDGWVERNMDSVPQSFSDTMLTSSHAVVLDAATEFLSDRMPEKRTTVDAPIPRKTTVRRDLKSALGRKTVAASFMASMNNLSATLAATTCNFIRCVKPNAAMDFGIFDSQYVVEQLRCLGVLRTCEVLKMGMPTRVSYVDMKQSLGEGALEAEKLFEGEPEKSLVAAILWAFDVPSEAFRLGAKRVFFRAGQIAVLHKILNETPADKVPWVLSRLRLALANRRMAKIAAEEAEDSLAEAEAAVMEAEANSSDTYGGGVKSNKKTPLSPGSSADADMRALVATVDKARRAARNAVQVKAILKSVDAEGIGEYAPGAAEKIKTASEAAFTDISKAAARADDLEKLTTLGVFGLDGSAGGETEMTSLRELHIAMLGIRDGLAEAKRHWKSAEESADKCQSKPAVDSSKKAKEKAMDVVAKATQVSENSKKAIDVARRQRRAKDVTTRATEKALKSFRSFQVVARQATLDEKRYRENPSLSAEAAAAAAAAAASSSKSTAPGSGLIQAAKAALAGAVAYESLTEDQKQQRLAEQRAASAEAAIAIAEAVKEEEERRLELAALERQRQQELEEEAAAGATDEAEGSRGSLHQGMMSAGGTRTSEKAKVTASAETAGSEGRDSSSRPPPVRSFLAARRAGAGGSPRASDPSSGSGMVPGSGSSRSRSLVRQNGGGSALEAAAAATAAVEAVTGVKSFSPRGAKEAVAREEAAAVTASTAGTGEEKPGMGRTELPESRAKAVEAQAKATKAKAKAAQAQAKAAEAHRKATEAHIKASEASGSQLGTSAVTTTTGWGENGDQLGPGSVKGRLGVFASGNSKDVSASETPVNGRSQGSRSASTDPLAADGRKVDTDAPVSTRTSGHEEVSSVDAEYGRSVTDEVVVASKIAVTGGFSRSTTSSLSPVLESTEEAPAPGVPVSSADGRVARRWVGADNDRDSPGYVEDGHGAFVHHDNADIGSTDDRGISGASACGAGGVQAKSGWGENGDQNAPGSIRGRLGAFSGKDIGSSRNVPGEDMAEEEENSASMVSSSGEKSGNQRTSRSVNSRLGALPGSNDGDVSSKNGAEAFFASNPDRRTSPGWGVNGSQSAPGSIKDRLGAYSGNNGVGTASGRRRSGNQTTTRSEGTKSISADASAVASTFCAVGMKLGNGEISGSDRSEGTSELSPIDVGDYSGEPGSVKGQSAALPHKTGESSAALPSEDDASVPQTAGASGEELEGEEEGKISYEGREQLPPTSGWGEGGDQAAPGSITDRLGKFSGSGSSSGTSRGRSVSSRGGSGFGDSVIDNDDQGYNGAPMKSPPSRERESSHASASASEETDELVSVDSQQGDNGDRSGDLSSVRARVAALSSKGSRVPRISGRSRVGGGSGKISSPGSRSPPYKRDTEAGASARGYAESEGSDVGEEEQVSGDGERPARSTGSGSVKNRLSALSGNKAVHQGSRSPRPGGARASMESIGGARMGLGSRSSSHESPTDDGSQERANMSPLSARVDRTMSVSFKERLAAFSKNSSSSGGSNSSVSKGDMRTRFGPASGTRSPSFKRGGSFKGGNDVDGQGESSPRSGGVHFKAAFSGRSPTYQRNGSRTDSSEDSKSVSSPEKPRSRKEEAIAVLAAAEEAAAREEEVWTRKLKNEGGNRRRRIKAAEGDDDFEEEEEEEGGGKREAGARRHKPESKHTFDDQDYEEEDDKQGFEGDSDIGMGAKKSRRRTMKKSGFAYGGGGGRRADGYDDGTGISRDIEGISEEDQEFEEEEERDEMRPWPEAGGDDEDIETMEAKKPMTGDSLSPWRSPERAPEYGNTGKKSNDDFDKIGYTRSASFAGNPSQARNSSWNRSGASSGILKNHSMAGDLGHQEEAMVSWEADPKKGEEGVDGGDVDGKGPVILESMLFKDDAKEVGIVEARVMSINSENKSGHTPRRAPKWNQYYFRLRETVLTKSPARRSMNPGKVQLSENMELTSHTITSFTNTKNCFCVRTGKVSWFLLGRSLADMKRWMHAINIQVRHVFQKEHGVEDDYQGQGRHGRFFYRMVEGSVPQWILTHPMAKAPRTGEGLFPGEVIEVTQVLSIEGSTFLRLPNDRGWTFARSPNDGSVLFEDLAGSVSDDMSTYSFPEGALGIVPILHGPGLRTQATGVTILAGERVEASERFTPVDGSSVVFIKLKDGRGWVPVKNNEYSARLNVLEGW